MFNCVENEGVNEGYEKKETSKVDVWWGISEPQDDKKNMRQAGLLAAAADPGSRGFTYVVGIPVFSVHNV